MRSSTESDIRKNYIDPAITKAGWTNNQVFTEYYFTDGQMIVRGNSVKRASGKKADYLLTNSNRNIPLAIIEAKSMNHSVGAGLQQAQGYAEILDVPFAYSSNGNGFDEFDYFTKKTTHLKMDEFPSESELWERYKQGKKLTEDQENIVDVPDYNDAFSKKRPRYYQRIAVQKTIEAISKGRNRLLLVMATGTGKTYTAFQIIWKLIEAKKVKRVLYLADRNILIDQTMQQDFKPFEKIMTKIKNKNLDSAYEVYMSLYQQLVVTEGEQPFKEFKPEFFDLIVIDEAHRGSAKEDSQWRTILEYFDSAIQIGMTATPKETKYISNIDYFGDPVYTYSLKQGIQDGFLAPYKVIRINIDRDSEGWRPYNGQLDVDGNLIEDREYNVADFDRKLVIDERTQEVAKRITQWLKENGRYSKTIVFCVDIDHAERMRQALVNENSDMMDESTKYVVRITGDSKEGKDQLEYFIDVNEKFPVIATTSKLMTTGVDSKTTQLIVLDTNINSMTEFKQIIGRGTRLYPEHGKNYFTIMDFRGVARLFADPAFDGEPIPDPGFGDDPEGGGNEGDSPNPPGDGEFDPPVDPDNKKYHINGIDVSIVNERVQYYDVDGKLIVESIKDYSKKNILSKFATMDEFLHYWNSAERKEAIIGELLEYGVLLDSLKDESRNDIDDFDLILHIAYDKKPLTKSERIRNVKSKGYLDKYSDICKEVLSNLLDKYKDGSIQDIEDTLILRNAPFDKLGTPANIAKKFGGKKGYLQAIKELENQIYNVQT